ncbi:MAG: Fic family protein [Phycisphaerae bacterium]|nr:Fic family protein [Phycisphaerae bacterium]
MKASGSYVRCSTAGEAFEAFVPAPLPPDPPLMLAEADQDLLEQANLALGRLDGLTAILPDSSVFLYGYIRKEALLSSQIEGTQSSLTDLVLHESHLFPGMSIDDVQEVSNYVAAMTYGLRRIREDGFPLSLRLLKEIHAVLMAKGRGSRQSPGEFRRSQNWIGGTRPGNAVFVPPPWEQVIHCLGNLEKFLHDQPRRTPVLIKAALAHVQFETIHPFLDGNGRLGRLLITLILCAEGALQEPLLYLSLYFKQRRQTYYEWLQQVRIQGDWLGWLRFFLEGIRDTAQQASNTAKAILVLFDNDRRKIEVIGRQAGTVQRVHQLLQRNPILSIARVAEALQVTTPTARAAVEALEKMKILREITGKRRGRLYAYAQYMKILNEGTEPLPR